MTFNKTALWLKCRPLGEICVDPLNKEKLIMLYCAFKQDLNIHFIRNREILGFDWGHHKAQHSPIPNLTTHIHAYLKTTIISHRLEWDQRLWSQRNFVKTRLESSHTRSCGLVDMWPISTCFVIFTVINVTPSNRSRPVYYAKLGVWLWPWRLTLPDRSPIAPCIHTHHIHTRGSY